MLLLGAILLIVIGPFLFVRKAHDMASLAADSVTHSALVEASVQALMYDARNRESATLAYAVGHDTQAIRERLMDSKAKIPQDLERVTNLTRDNAEQQVQVGRMIALIDQRGAMSADILSKPAGQAAPHEIEWLLDRNPLRTIGAEISDSEHALMQVRMASAKALEARSDTVTWLAAATQIVLLFGLALLLRWILESRRIAEANAQRSSARAEAVLQTVREPVVVLDKDLRVVMHNPAFLEVFGIHDSVVGNPLDVVGGGTWTNP
ncbi:MAG: CHASE3 domain-containing protein, partial [Thermomonas sp.]